MMWTSKLGNKFPREDVVAKDRDHRAILDGLQKDPGNTRCADCLAARPTWVSVNLGVFLCTRCSDIHRAVGTHISKVKGCTDADLWGPDEIAHVRCLGNAVAEERYGCKRLEESATKEERMDFCRRKYSQLPHTKVGGGYMSPATSVTSASSSRRLFSRTVSADSTDFADFEQPMQAKASTQSAASARETDRPSYVVLADFSKPGAQGKPAPSRATQAPSPQAPVATPAALPAARRRPTGLEDSDDIFADFDMQAPSLFSHGAETPSTTKSAEVDSAKVYPPTLLQAPGSVKAGAAAPEAAPGGGGKPEGIALEASEVHPLPQKAAISDEQLWSDFGEW